MTERKEKVFMAIAAGRPVTEGGSFPKYQGVANVFVVSVNPTKEWITEARGFTIEKDPEYVTKDPETKVKKAIIDIYVKVDSEHSDHKGVNLLHPMRYYLEDKPRISQTGKIQVVNLYGEFTWLPYNSETQEIGEIPEGYSFVGPYRPAYAGEESLTDFIKTYMNIPMRTWKNKSTGEQMYVENLEDAMCQLDSISEYFNGDFSEIESILTSMPDTRVKVAFGVRESEADNKQYQDVYTRRILKISAKDNTRLWDHIIQTKDSGGYKNTVFSNKPLHEYVMDKTTFEAPTSNGNSGSGSFWNK